MAVAGPGAGIESASAGRIVVNLLVDAADLLTAFGAGAKVYLERDTSSAFAAPTVLSSTAIVAGTQQLEFVDTSGTSSSWYRVRVGNTGGTAYTEYSNSLQAGSLRAYATLDDLVETMNVASTDTKALNVLADLLVDATDAITQMCGRSFLRSPQVSGTEARLFHVRRAGLSSLADAVDEAVDIIPGSIVSVEVADTTGGTYTTLAAGSTGYWSEPQNPESGWPIEDILLSRVGATYLTYPVVDQGVRITAAFGWPSVPDLVKRATIDLAREWYRQGPGGGGPVGVSALGQPQFGSGYPPTWWMLYRSDYRRRSFTYV